MSKKYCIVLCHRQTGDYKIFDIPDRVVIGEFKIFGYRTIIIKPLGTKTGMRYDVINVVTGVSAVEDGYRPIKTVEQAIDAAVSSAMYIGKKEYIRMVAGCLKLFGTNDVTKR